MVPADFETLLKTSMGLNVASIGSTAVVRAVQERVSACELGDAEAYWDRVRGSQSELQQLIEAVVVPETWFFRDREAFAAMAHLLREEWREGPETRVLKVLSLPCSTGEEPYSMAMAMLDASLPPGCFRVEAVDISTRALAQAARAVYGKNSFRGQDLSFRDRYFDTTLAGYRLHDAVRRQVHFQSGNLFAPDFLPGAEIYDVIFCRNVLIYFDRETQDRAIGVLQRLLKAKGTLFVAPAETGLTSSHDFVSTNLPLAFAFRRAPPRAAHAPIAAPLQPASLPRPVPSRPAASQASRPTAVPRLLPQTVVQKTPPSDDLDVALQLANQGHFVEAATHCEAHLRQHGPSATAFCLMGLVRDATGNHLDAGKYYRKALYLDPDNGETQIHLALLMEKQGDTAGAQVLRNRAKRLEHKRKISHE